MATTLPSAFPAAKTAKPCCGLLARWQAFAPFRFQLTAIHVTMPMLQVVEADAQAAALQTLLRIAQSPLSNPAAGLLAENEPEPLDCFRCSWNRRRTLFLAARETWVATRWPWGTTPTT